MGHEQYSSSATINRLQQVQTTHPWLQSLVARKLLEARARYIVSTEEEVRRVHQLPRVQG